MNTTVKDVLELHGREMMDTSGDGREQLFLLVGPEEANDIAKACGADMYHFTKDELSGMRVETFCGMKVCRANEHVAGRAVMRRDAIRELAIEAGFYPLDTDELYRYQDMDKRLAKAQSICVSLRRRISELEALNALKNNLIKLEKMEGAPVL